MPKEVEIAEKLGERMKAVSVAEFFKKNKHLLGFDNPLKSMLVVVKEAVDNALDATEEYAYELQKKGKEIEFPEIKVEIKKEEHGLVIIPEGSDIPIADLVKTGKRNWDLVLFGKRLRASKVEGNTKEYNVEGRKVKLVFTSAIKPQVYVDGVKASVKERTLKYKVSVTDNGPGIIESKIPNVFGKLLYGSKFHRLRQSRGQQGIGISSAVLYAQQTTGIPARITSKVKTKSKAVVMEISIADNNEPIIHSKEYVDGFDYEHGTKVELVIEADYRESGEKSVYEFIRRTAIVNPHATFILIEPNKRKTVFKRTSNKLPKEPKEIKPHPHGLEFGKLKDMLIATKARTIKSFLVNDLSRVSSQMADNILKKVNIDANKKPAELTRQEIEKLLRALHKAPLQRPSTDCLSPIGENALRKSILADTKAEFVAVVSRKPTVYKGIPFLVEAAIAYGGEIKSEGMAQRLRYANKIPLLYDAAGCATTKAIQEMNWKQYKVQSVAQNGVPMGPYVILIHLASVWVPYTSEGKSAIASYPEIIKEMKLALQDCARKLKSYLGAKIREAIKAQRVSLFEAYMPEFALALSKIIGVKEDEIKKDLVKVLSKLNKLRAKQEGEENEK
ncbi:MAG: DNA topoisomerase VI subunit B [Nanoarchaeota archaeon]|nr:DNA topoisomerase VI subunit B [Nanoarchaeota archaeon]